MVKELYANWPLIDLGWVGDNAVPEAYPTGVPVELVTGVKVIPRVHEHGRVLGQIVHFVDAPEDVFGSECGAYAKRVLEIERLRLVAALRSRARCLLGRTSDL